jgi:hypothetical protein
MCRKYCGEDVCDHCIVACERKALIKVGGALASLHDVIAGMS